MRGARLAALPDPVSRGRGPSSLESRVLPLLTTRGDAQLIAACFIVGGLTIGLAGGRFFLEGFGSPVGRILAAAVVVVAVLTGLHLGNPGFAGIEETTVVTLLRSGGLAGAIMAGGIIGWAVETTWRTAAETITVRAAAHPLTDLPGRGSFDKALGAALARASRSARPVGLAYLDLDNFKEVNDRFGHSVGDDALKLVALRLLEVTRDGETPYHLSGDEFCVILEDIDSDKRGVVSTRLQDAISSIQFLPSDPFRLAASVGVVVAETGESPEQVLSNADFAMYATKTRRSLQVLIDERDEER